MSGEVLREMMVRACSALTVVAGRTGSGVEGPVFTLATPGAGWALAWTAGLAISARWAAVAPEKVAQSSKKASRVYAAKREPWLERLPRPLMGRTCMMSSEYCMDIQYRFGAQNASHSDDKKCAQLTSAIRTAA